MLRYTVNGHNVDITILPFFVLLLAVPSGPLLACSVRIAIAAMVKKLDKNDAGELDAIFLCG